MLYRSQKTIILLLFVYFITVYGQPPNPQPSGGNATQLLSMINSFRVNSGKPIIPISKALMHVAQRHADAIFSQSSAVTSQCSSFTWPDNAPEGVYWKPCCYFRNYTNLSCMNNKTKEITSSWAQPYTADYYEISGGLTGFYENPETALFVLWTNTSGIKDTILNNGGWGSLPWRAIGLGIAGDARRRYSFLAFGAATDSNTWEESMITTPVLPIPVNNGPSPVPVPSPQSGGNGGNNPAGGNAEQLVALVNAYRAENGLTRISISKALMYTGQYHANAVANNESVITDLCSLFSWPSSPRNGDVSWTECCARNESKTATTCMTQKPKEITSRWSQPFNGTAYEIAAWVMNMNGEQAIFNVWKNSTNSTDFILGRGNWTNTQWKSIGAGIARAGNKVYGYLWLSTDVDSNEWRGFDSNSVAPQVVAPAARNPETVIISPNAPARNVPQSSSGAPQTLGVVIISPSSNVPQSSSNVPQSSSGAPQTAGVVIISPASSNQSHSNPPQPSSSVNASSNGSLSGILVSSGGNIDSLVNLVNLYREENGLARLVSSRALMYTGQYHADAIARNDTIINSQCTSLSWPSPHRNDVSWTPCCLQNNTNNFTCMNQKPREITARWAQPFNGDAYEISAWIMNMNGTSEQAIFNVWRNSTNSTNFILGRGNWTNSQWRSIGAGIARSGNKTYAYLWLSSVNDTNTWGGLISSPSNSSSAPQAVNPPRGPQSSNSSSNGSGNGSTGIINSNSTGNNNSASLRPSGGNPERLVVLVNNYLAENGRARLNTSRALMFTAQYHANAVANNESAITGQCTAFSWPSPPSDATWVPCCYTNSTNSSCMSQKPREITARWMQPFNSDAYEIAAWTMNVNGNTEEELFNVWKNSSSSTSFLRATDSWAQQQWRSIGVGIARVGDKTYAYLWLSQAVDTNAWQGFNSPSGLTSNQKLENTLVNEEIPSGASQFGYMIANSLIVIFMVLMAF